MLFLGRARSVARRLPASSLTSSAAAGAAGAGLAVAAAAAARAPASSTAAAAAAAAEPSLHEQLRDARNAGYPPTQPFHHAIPVNSLESSRAFYGGLLGCEEGRSSKTWIDYSLFGHQMVCHFASKDYRCVDYFNNVDADAVPVPHFGVVLSEAQFHALAARIEKAGVPFIVAPHLRFPGQPGEQWTMFFKDPSGNNLEFKAMTTPANLFARYVVKE